MTPIDPGNFPGLSFNLEEVLEWVVFHLIYFIEWIKGNTL